MFIFEGKAILRSVRDLCEASCINCRRTNWKRRASTSVCGDESAYFSGDSQDDLVSAQGLRMTTHLAALKKLERLRTFLRFALANKWIKKNPAAEIKNPRVHAQPTLPFTHEEMIR